MLSLRLELFEECNLQLQLSSQNFYCCDWAVQQLMRQGFTSNFTRVFKQLANSHTWCDSVCTGTDQWAKNQWIDSCTQGKSEALRAPCIFRVGIQYSKAKHSCSCRMRVGVDKGDKGSLWNWIKEVASTRESSGW